MTGFSKRKMTRGIFPLLVVGLFLLSSLTVIEFLPVTEGGSGDEQPMPVTNRLSGDVKLYEESADQMMYHTSQYAWMGAGVATGDVNGDDYDDMVIGADGINEVYVYFGMISAGGQLTHKDADVTLKPTGGNGLGDTIGVGDVDGDGIDDIVLGNLYGANRKGEAFVYYGRADWDKTKTYTTPDLKFIGETGESSTSYFGENVWIADLDNDDYEDIIVTEPYWYERVNGNEYFKGTTNYLYSNYTGLAFIFWGRPRTEWTATGGTIDCDDKNYTTDKYVRIKGWMPGGSNRYARMGYNGGQSLSSGDFNGDGYNDLTIGTGYYCYVYYSYYSSYSYAGAVWLLTGRSRSDWMQWGGHYDMMARNGDYMLFTRRSSSAYSGYNPRLGDLNGDGLDDLVISSRRMPGSYQGESYVIWGRSNTSSLTSTFWDSYPYGGYYNDINDVKDVTITGTASSGYMAQNWIDDFDDDGIGDLLVGAGNMYNDKNQYAAGRVGLFYGQGSWPSTLKLTDADWTVQGETRYSYLGDYYLQSMSSGDFNNDNIPDIVLTAQGRSFGSTSYCGAVYMFLTEQPDMEINKFELKDGDGEENNILCVEAGGVGSTAPVGDGIYTFWGNCTDSWTVNEASEIFLEFALKGEWAGITYSVGYNPMNDTFYIKDNFADALELVPEFCNYTVHGFYDAEINISIKVNRNFPTQDPFDVKFGIVRPKDIIYHEEKDMLRVEKDLTFDAIDMTVTQGGNPVERGDFIPGGDPLVISGLRAVYEDTDVSPTNEKFYIRATDNYLRVFENHSSAGLEIDMKLPTNVDSGALRFWIDIIITPEYGLYGSEKAAIAGFYVNMDFQGPEAPQNLKFHADAIDDPEGRWDNDNQIWVSWDPAFDTQVDVIGYDYQVRGPGSFLITGETVDRFTELTLAGSGVYTIQIWGIDEANNSGIRAIKSIILDQEEVVMINHYPSYLGEIWLNSKEVELRVSISDLVVDDDGPMLDLSTLKYLVTDQMSGQPTQEMWDADGVKAQYTLLSIDRGAEYIYTISAPVKLSEGKDNYIWWSVSDEAGNEGITTILDVDAEVENLYVYYRDTMNITDNMAREKAEENRPMLERAAVSQNPANAWVDLQAPMFTDPTPDPEPLETNKVTATVIIEDQGKDLSGVDASTIQYSISRNGISNYGGWTSAGLTDDGDQILASTTQRLFEPGSTNYVRWRAKDVAGNGFVVSDDYPILIEYIPLNNPPITTISSPSMQDVYDTQQTISFIGSDSSDPDLDALEYKWVLANKTILREKADFEIEARSLGEGVHVITLYVTDGWFTITDSISLYVKIHPNEVDTDGDTIPDGEDLDDDNDLLSDIEEAAIGTNPKLQDTDQDGVDDYLDPEPLNPLVFEKEDEKGYSTYYNFMIWIVILAILILVIAVMVVLKKRSTLEMNRVTRSVAREAEVVQRYEALTGIESELLPSVKDMGVSLPPVAAQQVAPREKAKKLDEIKEPVEEKVEEPEKAPEPAPAEPAPAPTPAPVRRVRVPAGSVPGQIPKPEDLTATPNLPGTSDAGSAGTSTTTCDLCGSSIEVPAGVSQVECPLCGEKKNL